MDTASQHANLELLDEQIGAIQATQCMHDEHWILYYFP